GVAAARVQLREDPDRAQPRAALGRGGADREGRARRARTDAHAAELVLADLHGGRCHPVLRPVHGALVVGAADRDRVDVRWRGELGVRADVNGTGQGPGAEGERRVPGIETYGTANRDAENGGQTAGPGFGPGSRARLTTRRNHGTD